MNKLQKGKQISDLLAKGVNVDEKEIEKLVNSMNVDELVDLFNYSMTKSKQRGVNPSQIKERGVLMRYELILNGKNVATIPQESIKAFALMRQLDKKVAHGKIHDIATAIESLIDEGFEVKEIEEKPLTEIPKVPNWYNRQHRDLYDKLECKSDFINAFDTSNFSINFAYFLL